VTAALTVLAFLALWQFAPVRRQSVPRFTDVAAEAVDVLGRPEFLGALGASAARWAVGLALAVVVGVLVGVAMGRSRWLAALLEPLLIAGFPVPKAALVLLFVLWWGAGEVSRVAVVVAGSLIPVVISAYHGARDVPPALLWSARALGTRRAWLTVGVPAALPQIVPGVRVALAIAIFTVLASELLIRGSGLGSLMFTALDNGQTLTVFALSVIVAVLGFALDALYSVAVRRALPWLG
jgi:ABC-type nitrate/sulfonate/bicarbonate transport system permease component